MDGSNPVILFTNSLDHVEFLTVDIQENKLYWAVTSTGTVGLLSPRISLLHVKLDVLFLKLLFLFINLA